MDARDRDESCGQAAEQSRHVVEPIVEQQNHPLAWFREFGERLTNPQRGCLERRRRDRALPSVTVFEIGVENQIWVFRSPAMQ